jgi:hypothetical protein
MVKRLRSEQREETPMTQVVVDQALLAQLHGLTQPLELCDGSGRVLAHLVPALDPSQYELVEPELSQEELQRRRLEPDYSTEEVLAHLEKP